MTMPTSQKKVDGGRVKGAQAVPNVVEVRCQLVLPNTKKMFMTFHGSYATTAPPMQTLATALFGSLSSAWSTNLASFMHTGTAFQNVFCRDMSNVTLPVYTGTGTAVAGTSASPAMPVSVAVVMTEEINARGRGAKGRVYLGGWATNADAGAGQIVGTVQTAVNNFGNAVLSALNAQSLTACVAQVARQQYAGITGTVHPQRNATHVQVNSYVCQDTLWDTQRRRGQL